MLRIARNSRIDLVSLRPPESEVTQQAHQNYCEETRHCNSSDDTGAQPHRTSAGNLLVDAVGIIFSAVVTAAASGNIFSGAAVAVGGIIVVVIVVKIRGGSFVAIVSCFIIVIIVAVVVCAGGNDGGCCSSTTDAVTIIFSGSGDIVSGTSNSTVGANRCC